MLLHFFSLFLRALSHGPAAGEHLRAAETAFAIQSAVCDDDGECDEPRGALLAVIAAEESRGAPGVRGDRGNSCGRWQLGVVARHGVTCDELDADPYLDARTAYAALLQFEEWCGSLEGALRAYATGSCSRGVDYQRRRCALAEACL